ncbi:hypothetical protein [Endozoicomonas sp. ONNA1]|uniref:hypothetical protein n=1 Tax=Endozoicomonas sp. ONNA1 TaxID=2828740 RepID=UPI0021481CFC|nr:hypothetical protein [Endozoicomonas sp. ONNA1]
MKTKQCLLKKRTGNIIFCFLFIISFSKQPVFAEEDTEGNASVNLVYFQPRIYIAEKAQPCIGVRVSKKQILTSPSCAKEILALFKQAVEINVLSPAGVKLGHVQTSHNRSAKAGLLSIDLYADNLPYQPPVMSTVNATNGTELSAYYMRGSDEEMNVTKHYFTFDDQKNSGVQTMIKLPSDISIPDGAPVKLRNKLFCVVVGDTCIRSSYLLNAFAKDNDPRCPKANATYYFNCGKRAIDNCHQDISPEEGIDIHASGACVNPESKEHCTFNSQLTFVPGAGSLGYMGAYDQIKCKSCSAQYSWTNSPPLPARKFVICTPKGCMPDCKDKPDPKPDPKHSGKKPVNSIVEWTVGGVATLALVGTVATVGYLMYKRRHRANYQGL